MAISLKIEYLVTKKSIAILFYLPILG